jgi:hypothetical protein
MEGIMKNSTLLAVFGFVVIAFVFHLIAQDGGNLNSDANTGKYKWSTEQALNSMADLYLEPEADSVGAVIATKYGTNYRCIRLTNNSGTMQKIRVEFVNRYDNGTRCSTTYNVDANSTTGKIPAILKVISGMVVDSTLLGLQRK